MQILKETSTKMYSPFQIRFNLQYGTYAHFGYWTLVSDPLDSRYKCRLDCYM